MTRGVETRLHSWNSWTLAVVFGSEGLATVSLLSLPCAMFCASYGRHLAAHSQGGWKPCLNRGGPGKRRKERLVSWVVPAIPALVKGPPLPRISPPRCASPLCPLLPHPRWRSLVATAASVAGKGKENMEDVACTCLRLWRR